MLAIRRVNKHAAFSLSTRGARVFCGLTPLGELRLESIIVSDIGRALIKALRVPLDADLSGIPARDEDEIEAG